MLFVLLIFPIFSQNCILYIVCKMYLSDSIHVCCCALVAIPTWEIKKCRRRVDLSALCHSALQVRIPMHWLTDTPTHTHGNVSRQTGNYVCAEF